MTEPILPNKGGPADTAGRHAAPSPGRRRQTRAGRVVPLLIVGALASSCFVGQPADDEIVAAFVITPHPLNVDESSAIFNCLEIVPCASGGMLRGIQLLATSSTPQGEIGYFLFFAEGDGGSSLEVVSERVEAAGYGPIETYTPNDEMPDCRGEPDCDLVKDTPAYRDIHG